MVEERTTVVGAVPTQWQRLVALAEVAGADLSALRIGICATAPASPSLIEAVRAKLGCPLVVRYAMTESPSIAGTQPTDPAAVQVHTVGRPQHGMQVSAPTGRVGAIRVRGACVMRGYWHDDERNAQAFDEDGWLITGDLGYLDADGNLVIAGRADDMYIRGGYNVYPTEVENVLARDPRVSQVGIVGTPGKDLGEIGVAFVVPAAGQTPPTLAELKELVRSELADYKAPDRLAIVDELPVTPMQKINKAALRKMAAETSGRNG